MLQIESQLLWNSLSSRTDLCGGVYKAEDVIEDVPATVSALELETLCKAHGFVLASELYGDQPKSSECNAREVLARSAPVTRTMIPSSAEG